MTKGMALGMQVSDLPITFSLGQFGYIYLWPARTILLDASVTLPPSNHFVLFASFLETGKRCQPNSDDVEEGREGI